MIQDQYKLPKSLTDFQKTFYIHLIQWKHKHITKEPGLHQDREYDAILPKEYQDQFYPLYRPIVDEVLKNHQFKPHKHFGHMASSQAACINLFTAILMNDTIANQVLNKIKPDFKKLATDQLESGFQFEYWNKSNPLNDHTPAAGTDSDIAIAYYNQKDELSLWLIEHKLTEKEFTTCGAYRSSGNKQKDFCNNPKAILSNNNKCYYQYARNYKYWELTSNSGLFDLEEMAKRSECPFLDGKNQLWRNQLMAYAIQKERSFKNAHFSVVYHHDNLHLSETINNYTDLLTDKTVFSTFTSRDLVKAASDIQNNALQEWISWYSNLYKI